MQVYYVSIVQSAKMLEFSSLNFNVVVATSGKTRKNTLKVFYKIPDGFIYVKIQKEFQKSSRH